MFEKFGNMDTCEEINELAGNLRKEGDTDSIRALAEENGIDSEIADMFISGELEGLCDYNTAAWGKLEIEARGLKTAEIINDWVDYIKSVCTEDEEMARGVRNSQKSLKGCIAALLKWSYDHATPIDKEITQAAGITRQCSLGMPGMGTAKRLIRQYYKEGLA